MGWEFIDAICDIKKQLDELKDLPAQALGFKSVEDLLDTAGTNSVGSADDSGAGNRSVDLTQRIPQIIPSLIPSYCIASGGCMSCKDVCPVQAFDKPGRIDRDICMGCGACLATCPMDALHTNNVDEFELALKVLAKSYTYEMCYITCECVAERCDLRDKDNVIVVPCLAALSSAWWLYVLQNPNLCIFIDEPCSTCAWSSLESVYVAAIEEAEPASRYPLGFENDTSTLNYNKRREVERQELLQELLQDVFHGLSSTSFEQALARKLQASIREFAEVEDALKVEWGASTQAGKVRRLTAQRTLALAALLNNPAGFEQYKSAVAAVDTSCCVGCGSCESICPVGAIEVINGVARCVPAFCVGCGLCVKACEDKALTIKNTPLA